jgi:hypothetical protein
MHFVFQQQGEAEKKPAKQKKNNKKSCYIYDFLGSDRLAKSATVRHRACADQSL